MLWLRAASGEQGPAQGLGTPGELSPAACQGQRPHLMCPSLSHEVLEEPEAAGFGLSNGKNGTTEFLNPAQDDLAWRL